MSRRDRREDIIPDDVGAPAHRPGWLRVDRLLGEHRIPEHRPTGRAEFERRMEARRAEATDSEEWAAVRRGWFLGSEEFRLELLDLMSGQLGEHPAGALRRESAEAQGKRIVAEELLRLGWTEEELARRHKSDPRKLASAARLRHETTLTVAAIAARLHLGTWKSARTRLQQWKGRGNADEQTQMLFLTGRVGGSQSYHRLAAPDSCHDQGNQGHRAPRAFR